MDYVVYGHKIKGTENYFYIGNGLKTRPYEMGKSRRNSIWFDIYTNNEIEVSIFKSKLSKKESSSLEVYYISKYRKLGFASANISDGGNGVCVENRWWGGKISESLKGIEKPKGKYNKSFKDFTTKEDLTEMYKDKNTTEIALFYNVSIPTVCARLKDYGIIIKSQGRTKKPIKCLNDNKVFKSLSEAARYYGIHRENISKVLTGKYKHTKKLKFIKL